MHPEHEPLHPSDVDALAGLVPPALAALLRRAVKELENHRGRLERLTELLKAHYIEED